MSQVHLESEKGSSFLKTSASVFKQQTGWTSSSLFPLDPANGEEKGPSSAAATGNELDMFGPMVSNAQPSGSTKQEQVGNTLSSAAYHLRQAVCQSPLMEAHIHTHLAGSWWHTHTHWGSNTTVSLNECDQYPSEDRLDVPHTQNQQWVPAMNRAARLKQTL